MALRLIYQMFAKLLSWIVLYVRSDTANEIETLVLRHQLAVLQRRTPRPRISWSDRAMIAALGRLLPAQPARRRRGFLITPATILRWHRQLVRRRWTTQPVRPGRPAIPAGGRAVIVRLANENPSWRRFLRAQASSMQPHPPRPDHPAPALNNQRIRRRPFSAG